MKNAFCVNEAGWVKNENCRFLSRSGIDKSDSDGYMVIKDGFSCLAMPVACLLTRKISDFVRRY